MKFKVAAFLGLLNSHVLGLYLIYNYLCFLRSNAICAHVCFLSVFY